MVRMMEIIGLLLVIFSLGCVNNNGDYRYVRNASGQILAEQYTMQIDVNFTPQEKTGIKRGIDQWNYALNGLIEIKVISETFNMEIDILRSQGAHDWVIMKTDESNPMIDKPDTLGFVDYIGGNKIWIVMERMDVTWVAGVTMHEIGHLLGLKHSENLMAPRYQWNQARCVDYEAVQQLSQVKKIDLGDLNYCYYY